MRRVAGCWCEQGQAQQVQCQYAVAAEGAGSRARRSLGIGLQGQAGLQHLCNIHFLSPQLGALLQGRPGMLYFCFGPAAVAVLVAHDLQRGEFVMQVPHPHTTLAGPHSQMRQPRHVWGAGELVCLLPCSWP